ncbi:uncharacterized protein [Montipora foliosa]|uniref:uncharacterized protein isoform X2 n=1 Tax=Montipora foliosa TaxID=591990 RepID=UPI0035F1107C
MSICSLTRQHRRYTNSSLLEDDVKTPTFWKNSTITSTGPNLTQKQLKIFMMANCIRCFPKKEVSCWCSNCAFFRSSRKNRLFAGLWFGKGKPHLPTFLRPFSLSIQGLFSSGLTVPSPTEQEYIEHLPLRKQVHAMTQRKKTGARESQSKKALLSSNLQSWSLMTMMTFLAILDK